MRLVYFAWGLNAGALLVGAAAQIHGSIPVHVFVIAWVGFVFAAIVIWIYDRSAS